LYFPVPKFVKKYWTYPEVQLTKDNIVVVTVRVDDRDGEEPRYSATKIDVVKADTGPRELRLCFQPEQLTAQTIATLKEILVQFPGPSPVVLEVGEGGQAFQLGEDFNVSIAAVVPDLRSEFGRDVIKG